MTAAGRASPVSRGVPPGESETREGSGGSLPAPSSPGGASPLRREDGSVVMLADLFGPPRAVSVALDPATASHLRDLAEHDALATRDLLSRRAAGALTAALRQSSPPGATGIDDDSRPPASRDGESAARQPAPAGDPHDQDEETAT